MEEDSRDGHVSSLIGLSCFSSSLDATADVLKRLCLIRRIIRKMSMNMRTCRTWTSLT